MIKAEFGVKGGKVLSATISGHAGYASSGEDIVCACVTSATQMAANGITEILKVSATVFTSDNKVTITLPDGYCGSANHFLAALMLHLRLIQEDYPKNLKLTELEV